VDPDWPFGHVERTRIDEQEASMSTLFSTCVAVCIAGLSVAALAGSNADPPTPHPEKGNQSCYLILLPDNPYANPGTMFQAIRQTGDQVNTPGYPPGGNPRDWYDYIVDELGNPFGYENVGAFIDGRCAPQY